MPSITTSTIGEWEGEKELGGRGENVRPKSVRNAPLRAFDRCLLASRRFSTLDPRHFAGFPRIGPKREMKKALEA